MDTGKEWFEEQKRAGYNRVPVTRTHSADLQTPLAIYLKMANAPYSYLLESVQGGEQWGRYSIIGLPAKQYIQVCRDEVSLWQSDQCVHRERVDDPLAWIESYRCRFRSPSLPGGVRFGGGLVGYFGYDTIRYVEQVLADGWTPSDEEASICLLISEELVLFDNLSGRLSLVVYVDPEEAGVYDRAQDRLDELSDQLMKRHITSSTIDEADVEAPGDLPVSFSFPQEDYKEAVRCAKEHIRDGDVMQVVLSQQLSMPCTVPPINVYRALRTLNPSPYLYYFDMGDQQIIGSSPEVLVRVIGDTITVRPIAGTRPRGRTPEEDQQLEKELLSDPKELAEHLMLIDLGRNDVGRVAATGSVRVTEQMITERYSHVMHIVSNVTGRLREGLSIIDVLRATFPAGTVSGAPKIRAMQLIDELEVNQRGIYAGAIGYISWAGNMDLAIAIRTGIVRDKVLYVRAGGGIVADSDPQKEWQETLNKGEALLRAMVAADRTRLVVVER